MLIRMRDVMALTEQAARQAVRPKSAVDKRAATSLLSVAAASKLIGVCTRTFKGHVDAGEIPYIPVGRGLQHARCLIPPILRTSSKLAGDFHVRLHPGQKERIHL